MYEQNVSMYWLSPISCSVTHNGSTVPWKCISFAIFLLFFNRLSMRMLVIQYIHMNNYIYVILLSKFIFWISSVEILLYTNISDFICLVFSSFRSFFLFFFPCSVAIEGLQDSNIFQYIFHLPIVRISLAMPMSA